jgi:hypothetical protein
LVVISGLEHLAYNLGQWACVAEDLCDSHRPNWNDESRFECLHFANQEGPAVGYLIGAWSAIPTALGFPWKAAIDGSKVDRAAHGFLLCTGSLSEPAKERLARCPRKGLTELSFVWARRLANQKNATHNGRPVDDGPDHFRAPPAGV